MNKEEVELPVQKEISNTHFYLHCYACLY